MERLIVEIRDKSKVEFVKELLGSFDYISVKRSTQKKASKSAAIDTRVAELKEAFDEVELHGSGKKNLKSLDQLIDEL